MNHPRNRFGKYQCPCCGYFTYLEPRDQSLFQDCDVCGWEDDLVQLVDPDYEGGANELSLNQARACYLNCGASDARDLGSEHIRAPQTDELGPAVDDE